MLTVSAGIGLFSLMKINRLSSVSAELIDDAMPAMVAAQRMNTLSSDFRIVEMFHVLATSAEEMAEDEKHMARILQEFSEQGDIYNRFLNEEQEINLFGRIKTAMDKYLELHNKLIELSRDMKVDEAHELLEDESGPYFDELSGGLLELVYLNIKNSHEAGRDISDEVASARYLIAGSIVVSLIIGTLLAVFLLRDTMRLLGKDPRELDALARRVAAGDYTLDDDGARQGVYASIVEMVEALKKHIEDAKRESEVAREQTRRAQEAVQEAEEARRAAENARRDGMLAAAGQLEGLIDALASASDNLASRIEQSDKGAAAASQRLGETATAMTQMNASVQDIAGNADNASNATGETKEKAVAGARIVDKAVQSIANVHQRSLGIKEDMEQLNQHAQAISRIMDVISDIADQTNLLALNAAIEAARAGEAGRGFAVVADEVRKLAEKTMDSTSEVGGAIRAIQESVGKSLEGVDKAVEVIREATELANQSGGALQEIVSTVEGAAEQVSTIAAASEEQSAASEEINRNIVVVSDIVQQTAAAMTEASQAVASLAEQSQSLARLVQQMKNS